MYNDSHCLAHKKPRTWENHRYIRIENGRYIYPEDIKKSGAKKTYSGASSEYEAELAYNRKKNNYFGRNGNPARPALPKSTNAIRLAMNQESEYAAGQKRNARISKQKEAISEAEANKRIQEALWKSHLEYRKNMSVKDKVSEVASVITDPIRAATNNIVDYFAGETVSATITSDGQIRWNRAESKFSKDVNKIKSKGQSFINNLMNRKN